MRTYWSPDSPDFVTPDRPRPWSTYLSQGTAKDGQHFALCRVALRLTSGSLSFGLIEFAFGATTRLR